MYVILGNIPSTQTYQNVSRYRDARRVPSFVILSVEAPFYFANATYLQERILRWIREEEELVAANSGSAIKCVIIDMTAVTAIDASGLETIKEHRKMLEKRSLNQLVLANPVGSLVEKLKESNILDSFGLNGIYLSVGEAVADIPSICAETVHVEGRVDLIRSCQTDIPWSSNGWIHLLEFQRDYRKKKFCSATGENYALSAKSN